MPAHVLRALPRATSGRHRAPRTPLGPRHATALGAVLTSGAIAAGSLLTAPAASAGVDYRPASRLWLGPDHSLTLRPGSVVRYSVHLQSGSAVWAGQTVRLYERDTLHGSWLVVGRGLTNAKGWVGFTDTVRATSQYVAVFGGSLAWRASSSNVGVVWTPRAASVAPAPAPAPAPAASTLGQRAVYLASLHAGQPYVYGAAGPAAFDCSGLTSYVYGQLGHPIPRVAGPQYYASYHVSQAAAQPGDLIFFYSGSYIYHVGIYAGHGMIWHAPHSGTVVQLSSLWTSAYLVGRVR